YTEFDHDPTPAIIAASRATLDSKPPKRRSVLEMLQSPFNNLLPTPSVDGSGKKATGAKKTKTMGTTSRNGPNGIVISAPIRPPSEVDHGLGSKFSGGVGGSTMAAGPAPPPPIYHRGDE
ncbi:hypothetical protein BMF94_6706, partial [Rhodotorula taiwanensis]